MFPRVPSRKNIVCFLGGALSLTAALAGETSGAPAATQPDSLMFQKAVSPGKRLYLTATIAPTARRPVSGGMPHSYVGYMMSLVDEDLGSVVWTFRWIEYVGNPREPYDFHIFDAQLEGDVLILAVAFREVCAVALVRSKPLSGPPGWRSYELLDDPHRPDSTRFAAATFHGAAKDGNLRVEVTGVRADHSPCRAFYALEWRGGVPRFLLMPNQELPAGP